MNDNYTQYDGYFSMSLAYLEIGEYAAAKDSNSGDYQNALAYQFFHALELFLKYAILLKTREKELRTHDLNTLSKTYYQLYPDEIYHIDNPFDFSDYQAEPLNPNEKELFKKHTERFDLKIMDQHLRYPASEKNGGYSFKLDSDIFSNMREKFIEINQHLPRLI